MSRLLVVLCCFSTFFPTARGAAATPNLSAARTTPNLVGQLERPLRYQPDGADFVIENGTEFFNRSLYGGNTAFRVDGGDRPEFVLYLPGRGGNLRFGLHAAAGTKWLHDAAHTVTRYRPGQLLYEISDPLLGAGSVLRLSVVALVATEGLIVRAERVANNSDAATPASEVPELELVWAYGGVNGQRGKRDGDIGTESVPISQWFQLRPEFCRGNTIEFGPGGFVLRAKPATIAGLASPDAQYALGDAAQWDDLAALLASSKLRVLDTPVVVGRAPLAAGQPLLIALQRLAPDAAPAATADELDTYRAVTADRASAERRAAPLHLAPRYTADQLPRLFAGTERYFRDLRNRVKIDTPDPFLNAAASALNVAADAAWDEPQQAIMHGAIAWRTRLLGWRGPYALDALGWHERAREHFTYWAGRQNTDPIPAQLPPADENTNLARNETGLHTNGDLSNSHYDMNLVAIDALFRHLQWTGDRAFAEKMWPVIERHLAWERRLFRREFGPEKLPLYEAYAAIWASDDLQYHGGGATHATAYNYFHHRQAARLARILGKDAAFFEREAELIARGLRAHLWLPEHGWFAEYKDLLGLQRVHPSAGLWTFYHTMDSAVPTQQEAWTMTRQVNTQIPHLPVHGPGVPDGLYVLSTTNWMPYTWSINNVVLSEIAHTALGFWQAGRPDEAWRMTKGALLAAMFMGISPGNVGSMSYLDVYRRESQRDFADGSGVLSRALVEGLFGLKPDVLDGELRVTPGFPAEWDRASLRHPDVSLRFTRTGDTDHYVITQRFNQPLALRLELVARGERVGSFAVNGDNAEWNVSEDSVGAPRIVITSPAGSRHEILITWAGEPPAANVAGVRDPGPGSANPATTSPRFTRVSQGQMRWWQPIDTADVWRPRISGLAGARVGAPAGVASDARTEALRNQKPEVLSAPPIVDAGPDAPGATHPQSISAGAQFDCVDLTSHFNDRVTQIFKHEYRSPRSPFVSLALPKQGIGGWPGGVNATAEIDDTGLRALAAQNGGRLDLPSGLPFRTPAQNDANNIVFTSQWDNYPAAVTVPLGGRARTVVLLMAGSTNHMQSRFDNGEVIVTYTDGSTERLALENPTNWWPIDQDYFIDDYQFHRPEPLPTRVDLKTGRVRELDLAEFKGRGGKIAGGAATVFEMALAADKELQSLTVRALANEVVIGLMAATLVR